MLALSVSLANSVDGTPSLAVIESAAGGTASVYGTAGESNNLLVIVTIPSTAMPDGDSFRMSMEIDDFKIDRILPESFLGVQGPHNFYVSFSHPNGGSTTFSVSQPFTEPYGPPWSVSMGGVQSSTGSYFDGGPSLIPANGALSASETEGFVQWRSGSTDFASYPYPGVDPSTSDGDYTITFQCSCPADGGVRYPAHAGVINVYVEPASTAPTRPFWTDLVGTTERL